MTEHVIGLIWDAWRTRRKGFSAIAQRQRARLADMVTHARANSPYYRELYRDLPDRVERAEQLPVTDKKTLMARFDDWCVDRQITLEPAQAFAEDSTLIGERFLGKYTLLTTSGTTGTRGVFVVDDRSMAVTSAMAFRMLTAWLGAGDFIRIVAGGGSMAMVMATGGHFASAVAAARLKTSRGRRLEVLSVHMPLQELVTRLNQFRPVLLAPYASMAALLASEQEGGRLHINPVLLALSAEGLPEGEYDRIARAFKAKVGNSYAATECPFFSYSCEHGWLHVNSDWVVFEPVDAGHLPVPLGDPNVVFVDVREGEELKKTGKLRGAVHVPRGFLEFYADPTSPTHKPELGAGKKLVLYCGSGSRSALGAKALLEMGVTDVAHVAGGFPALQQAGGPREEADR